MFGFLELIFLLGASLAITPPYGSTHQLTEFSVIEELGEIGSGLFDEGLRAIAYADQFLDNVNSPAFKKIVTLYKKDGHRLDSCGEPLAADLDTASACFCITSDLANITQLFLNSTQYFSGFFIDFVSDMKELNDCESATFFKKFGCYVKAFGDCQVLVKKYTIRINELIGNTTAVLQDLKIDIHKCFSNTNTVQFSERFEKNIALCKLKLI